MSYIPFKALKKRKENVINVTAVSSFFEAMIQYKIKLYLK